MNITKIINAFKNIGRFTMTSEISDKINIQYSRKIIDILKAFENNPEIQCLGIWIFSKMVLDGFNIERMRVTGLEDHIRYIHRKYPDYSTKDVPYSLRYCCEIILKYFPGNEAYLSNENSDSSIRNIEIHTKSVAFKKMID